MVVGRVAITLHQLDSNWGTKTGDTLSSGNGHTRYTCAVPQLKRQRQRKPYVGSDYWVEDLPRERYALKINRKIQNYTYFEDDETEGT